MILTGIGEVGVRHGGKQYVLRPSLYAISQLGDGAEIVRTYASVMDGNVVDALALVLACAEDDVSPVFGWCDVVGGRAVPRLQLASLNDLVRVGQLLARHGIAGDVERTKGAEYAGTFEPREFVALAQAHLGVSEAEAWGMTMTSLLLAMQAKYPAPEKQGPTLEDYEAHDEWYEQNVGAH